jgi:hypothetical protein
MKRFKFLWLPLFAAAMYLFAACAGGATKDDVTSDTANNSAADTPAVAASTIVTTPQGMMVVMHKVRNFDEWLASYDSRDSMRVANGIHSYVVGRGVDDPDMLFVATKVDDIEKAKAFGKSADLKQAMQKAGATGIPDMNYYITTWQDTSALGGSAIRSRTTFTIKDWAAWEKNFIEGRQERISNGIVDRAYGHDASDNTKVFLVTALTDTARAFAYYKSDALKQRRAAGGVTSEPKRFLFTIAKRY